MNLLERMLYPAKSLREAVHAYRNAQMKAKEAAERAANARTEERKSLTDLQQAAHEVFSAFARDKNEPSNTT